MRFSQGLKNKKRPDTKDLSSSVKGKTQIQSVRPFGDDGESHRPGCTVRLKRRPQTSLLSARFSFQKHSEPGTGIPIRPLIMTGPGPAQCQIDADHMLAMRALDFHKAGGQADLIKKPCATVGAALDHPDFVVHPITSSCLIE